MIRNPKLSAAKLAVCIVAASLAAAAQQLPTAKPESVGLSSERLERIATAVQRAIDEKRIAGAVTLVARHGRVAWHKAQGMMDREASKPMRTDAIFRICSMSKPITSLAVMMLYEEGTFLLDDPDRNTSPNSETRKCSSSRRRAQPTPYPRRRKSPFVTC